METKKFSKIKLKTSSNSLIPTPQSRKAKGSRFTKQEAYRIAMRVENLKHPK